jgi:Dolichyl-phosphate-mannose-protein mannosyltransferase
MTDPAPATIAAPSHPNNHSRKTAVSATSLIAGAALAKLLLQLAGITHYGFFRDELYYMACGEHLAWGYVDQPPFVALVAWFSRHFLGNSLFSYRLLPVLAGAAVVCITGLFARDLGGGRSAQFLACIGILFAPAYLAFDSFLSMNAFEPLFWLLGAWIVLRISQGASPRFWLLFGIVAGIGLENKHTMLVFGFALVAGLLLSGETRLFHSKWIWIGAVIALAIFLPNLLWEAHHGWPQFEVVRNAQQFKNVHISPLLFLVDQILFLNPVALPLWLAGLAWYLFPREGKRFRFFGFAYLIVLGVFITLDGKSYYPLPVYPIVIAAGGVAFEKFAALRSRRWLQIAFPALLVIAGLATVPFGVPLLPVGAFLRYANLIPIAQYAQTEQDATVALPQLYADMVGWQNTAETISRVYHDLPKSEQPDCAILPGNYGEAGAIDYYGPSLGLPKAISGHNSYFYWGPRNYSGGCVILFGDRAEELKKLFGDVQQVATISNPLSMPIERQMPVYLCRKPRAPLAELWPHFKMII